VCHSGQKAPAEKMELLQSTVQQPHALATTQSLPEPRSPQRMHIIIGPAAPDPWAVPSGANPEQYYTHLIGRATMTDLLAVRARPGAEKGYEAHAAMAIKVCGLARPPTKEDLATRLGGIFSPLRIGEPEFFAGARIAETSVPHAAAFDELVAGVQGLPVNPVDLMWCLSRYETAKRAATISINESRGTHQATGTGYRCPKCDKDQAFLRPVQMNAGDEGNKFQVICLNPNCRAVEIMD
jgi:hypothetical protein